MKKMMVLLMTFLFSISLVFAQNDVKVKVLNETEGKIKEEIKETQEDLKHSKRELKAQVRKRLEGSNVSDKSKENFNGDFGRNTDVVWTRGDFYDVAKFTEDGYAKKAYYDFDSQLIGSTWFVTFADIPERAQEIINEKYKEYKIGEVLFYDDNEIVDVDFFIFDSQFKHEDNYFVDLKNESKHIILRIDNEGEVHLFKVIN